LTKVVGSETPFQRTVELFANPEPLTVRLNAAPPACAEDGFRLLITGALTPARIVKAAPLLVVPFVLTVTVAFPCVAMRLAPTAAVSWVALKKLVGREVPFHMMVELTLNPEPFTVRVKACPPACADDGLRPLIAGVAVAMVNVELLDVVPPLLTVMIAVPCVAIRLAAADAVNCVGLPNVVGRGVPFHVMVELAVNPEPLTVRRNAAPPTWADDGLRLLITGFAVPDEIVNAALLDTVAFVLTVTDAVPCVAMRIESTIPDNWVGLTSVVCRGVPFHKMVELAVNPEPVTAIVNAAPPACADDGLMLLIVAIAGAMVNVKLLDTVPLALTVTVAVPCPAIRVAVTVPVS
jgi:hypothetical protein